MWIEVKEELEDEILRTYLAGTQLASIVDAARTSGLRVNLSFLNIKWVTVDFIAGFKRILGDYRDINFHFLSSQVATMLGAKYDNSSYIRGFISSNGADASDRGHLLGSGSWEVDSTGG